MTQKEFMLVATADYANARAKKEEILKILIETTEDHADSLLSSLEAVPLREALRRGWVVPASQTPIKKLETAELRQAIEKVFKILTKREKLAMELVYLEGLTLKEAGEVMNTTLGGVSQLCLRGRRKCAQRGGKILEPFIKGFRR